MKKKIFIFLLIAIILLLIFFQSQDLSLKILTDQDQLTIEEDFIYHHPHATLFPAVVRSSGKKPVETEYKGIELSLLFESLGVDISDNEKFTFNASDGYRIILSVEELQEPNNVYLTFQRDGKYLKSKSQGGNGPLQLVIRRDPFSQRWIKHVDEIILD